jgi:hypothetical protein
MKDGVEPTDAIRDIEGAVSLGGSSVDTYFRAAKIYGYACSFDEHWRNKALQFTALSLQRGIPVAHIKSDAFVNSVFAESSLAAQSWLNRSENAELEWHCFLCPVD